MVGAGRGPLVAGCLRATKTSGRFVKIYAVEKNPNAFVTFVLPKFHALVVSDGFADCKRERNTNGLGM